MSVKNTPWGHAQNVKELAQGITSVSTASHGGIHLSHPRLEHLLTLIPKPSSYAGLPWFEEDCDWAYVALAFPNAFDDYSVQLAVDMAKTSEYLNVPPSYWQTPEGQTCKERAELFRRRTEHQWRTGSMGSGGHGWQVNMTRGKESKWVFFPECPKQTHYTDAELAQIADQSKLVLVEGGAQ